MCATVRRARVCGGGLGPPRKLEVDLGWSRVRNHSRGSGPRLARAYEGARCARAPLVVGTGPLKWGPVTLNVKTTGRGFCGFCPLLRVL